MALKLDEDYNGSTLLSSWWQKVKSNFAALKAAVDTMETEKANTADVENALEKKADKAQLHTHTNKSILDGITQATVNGWQEVADAVEDLNKEMSGEYESFLGDEIIELRKTVEDLCIDKQDITTFNQNYTISDVVLTPADNNEYLYGVLTSLALTFVAPVAGYAAWITFTSGETATEMEYEGYIFWSGDDVLDNVFVPLSNKRYNIGVWYDGVNVNAAVRGVEV